MEDIRLIESFILESYAKRWGESFNERSEKWLATNIKQGEGPHHTSDP